MLRLRILDATKCSGYGNSDVQSGETRPCDQLPVSRYVPLCICTRGSHRQYRHPDQAGTVTIPGKPSSDLAPGTWRSIRKQAGMED